LELKDQVVKLCSFPNPSIAILARQVLKKIEATCEPKDISKKREEDINYLQNVIAGKEVGDANRIKKLLSSNDKFILSSAVKAAAVALQDKAIPLIIPFLSDSDPRVVANTIEALDLISAKIPEFVIEKVSSLLEHQNHRVVTTAAEFLLKHTKSRKKSDIIKQLFRLFASKKEKGWKLAILKTLSKFKSFTISKFAEKVMIAEKDPKIKQLLKELATTSSIKSRSLDENSSKKEQEKSSKNVKTQKPHNIHSPNQTQKTKSKRKFITSDQFQFQTQSNSEKPLTRKLIIMATVLILGISSSLLIFKPSIRDKLMFVLGINYENWLKNKLKTVKKLIDKEAFNSAYILLQEVGEKIPSNLKEKLNKTYAYLFLSWGQSLRLSGDSEEALKKLIKAWLFQNDKTIKEEIVWLLIDESNVNLLMKYYEELKEILYISDYEEILKMKPTKEQRKFLKFLKSKDPSLYNKINL